MSDCPYVLFILFWKKNWIVKPLRSSFSQPLLMRKKMGLYFVSKCKAAQVDMRLWSSISTDINVHHIPTFYTHFCMVMEKLCNRHYTRKVSSPWLNLLIISTKILKNLVQCENCTIKFRFYFSCKRMSYAISIKSKFYRAIGLWPLEQNISHLKSYQIMFFGMQIPQLME